MPNAFFNLQSRLASLLAGAAYFAGLAPAQILTEQIGDLTFEVEQKLLPLGFGVVVTTAAGKPLVSSYGALLTLEDLNVSLIHCPQRDPAHNVLDALAAAIAAIHGQSVQPTPPLQNREHDYFAVTDHQRRADAPPDLHVHELHVTAGLRLL